MVFISHVGVVAKDRGKFITLLIAVALAIVISFGVWMAVEASSTLVVDDDGMATGRNCDSNSTAHATISAAVVAAPEGAKIKVCPGNYPEDVLINKSLKLEGAKEDKSFEWRTFSSPSESTIDGLVTIDADKVTLDGFSLTNPGAGLGVLVKTAGDRANIVNNIIDGVGGPAFVGHTVGIYLEHGPDKVKIARNWISDVESAAPSGSAQGVLVGDSVSANPSLDVLIEKNKIEDLTSSRGAYGIQVNNGSSTAPGAVGYTTGEIERNTIKNLTGLWVHAIGLEGETPGLKVLKNTVSDLTPGGVDASAVFFEANGFFATVEVHENKFNVPASQAGIFLHPALSASHGGTGDVDGTCNWWNSSTGPTNASNPGGVGTVAGADVEFDPWLTHPNGNCHHDHDHDDD